MGLKSNGILIIWNEDSFSVVIFAWLWKKKPCGGTSIRTGGVHDHFLLEAEHAQLLLLNFLFYF